MHTQLAFNHICLDLCYDRDSSESELISQLISVLRTNPEVLYEQDIRFGQTVLHCAAKKRSVEFIKVLVEADGGLEAVRTADDDGILPIHEACKKCNVEAAKYFYSIYPESINIADNDGDYPLHYAISKNGGLGLGATDEDLEDLIRFLLKNDQGAVSQHHGALALHIACLFHSLDIVKLVYNKYPRAIHTRADDGRNPLDCCENTTTRTFLEAQLEWEREASEQRQPDEQGRLPIHRLLQSPDAPVGTVELMTTSNPETATVRDHYLGFIPLHYACSFCHLDVVKFLVDSNEDSLQEVTLSGELPLHIACHEGKCGVVNYILEKSDFGVSTRNNDGKLPIELLICADVNRDCLKYIEAVNRLLRAYPGVLILTANNGNLNSEGISRDSRSLKRKHESI
jgi:ankyrin repeat protein